MSALEIRGLIETGTHCIERLGKEGEYRAMKEADGYGLGESQSKESRVMVRVRLER